VITYAWEPLTDLLADGVDELTRRHWQEVAGDCEAVPLDCDWSLYLAAEARGEWRAFAARKDGRMIGYICWWINRPIRYRSTLYCECDVFWIAPEHRKGLTGYRLFVEALNALPKPCRVILQEKLTFKDGRVGRLLERLGLRPVEIVYTTFLSGE